MYIINKLDNTNYNLIEKTLLNNETQKNIIDSLYNNFDKETIKKLVRTTNKYGVSKFKKTISSKKRTYEIGEMYTIKELSIIDLVIFKNKINILKYFLMQKIIPMNTINKSIKLCEELGNYECKILLENYKEKYNITKNNNKKSESLRKKVLNANLNDLNKICANANKQKNNKKIDKLITKFSIKKQSINSLCQEFKKMLNLK